jgi:hypothetical protein
LLKENLAKVRFGWFKYKEYCFYYFILLGAHDKKDGRLVLIEG